MKIETTALMPGGAPRRRVLFDTETARRTYGVEGGEKTRATILQDCRDWARWASSLVTGEPRISPPTDEGGVEIR